MNQFFSAQANTRGHLPQCRRIVTPPVGNQFEIKAFAALYAQAPFIGIESLWRCYAARMDGYLITATGEVILLEMKQTLGFGSVQAATFEFITGRKLLNVAAARGLIVFRKKSAEWERCRPNGAWGQLQLHSEEIPKYVNLTLGGIQIDEENRLIGPGDVAIQSA
jgi:hypothetical protein